MQAPLECCARVLVVVAAADGEISLSELRALAELLGEDASSDHEVTHTILRDAQELRAEEVLERLAREHLELETVWRRFLFDAACAVAHVDGRCTEDERQLLASIHAHVGHHVELEASLRHWHEHLAMPLRNAEHAHVRTVSQLGTLGEFDTSRYAMLAERLRARSRGLLVERLPCRPDRGASVGRLS